MGVLESYQKIYEELQQLRPENPPTLIAVSKFQPIEKSKKRLDVVLFISVKIEFKKESKNFHSG